MCIRSVRGESLYQLEFAIILKKKGYGQQAKPFINMKT